MATESSSDAEPLVSIILPAYNAARYLPCALASVLDQSYRNLEILIIDDGSTDATAAVARRFADTDPRVQMFQQPNSGVAAARNAGIQQSTGDWIAPIDADDIWHPDKIAQQMRCAEQASMHVGLIYAWSVDIDESGRPKGDICVSNIEGYVLPTLLSHNFLGNASVPLIRRRCLDQVGLYDTRYKAADAQGCEDWDLWFRIAESYEFKVVPEFLVGYRKTAQSMSRDYGQMARSHGLFIKSVKTRRPEIPPFLHRISRGNLYAYFARNSVTAGDHRQALHWLKESVQADWLTPFLRLTLYQLLTKSLLGLLKGNNPPPRDAEDMKSEAPAVHEFPRIDTAKTIGLELWRDRMFDAGIKFFCTIFGNSKPGAGPDEGV